MKRWLPVLCLVLLAPAAGAETAFQFNAPNHQSPQDPDVNGMRFSIFHGKNQNVRGFDVGLLSLSDSVNFSGLALTCGINRVTGEMNGGAAISLINVHTSRDSGVNAAFINKLNNPDKAVDISFLNLADGTTMFDLGGFNISNRSAVQLGFVNVTNEITGFQFGFVNIAENGFLPVFPVFNFPNN